MKRRRVRSLEHYEAQAHKRRKMHEGLEPRVIKPPREEIKLYTFSQLCQLRDIEEEANKKAKVKDRKWNNAVDKALEWWRSQESVELDYTLELWGQALDDIGFNNGKINYSGFYRQGDGASFTAGIDLNRLIDFMCGEAIVKDCIDVREDKSEDFWAWVRHKTNWGDGPYPAYFKRLKWLENHFFQHDVTRSESRYSHENTCSTNISLGSHSHKMTRCEQLVADFEKAVESLRVSLCRAIYKSLEEDYEYQHSEENLAEVADANNYWFRESGRWYADD